MIGGAALLIALALGLGVWVSQSGRAASGAPAHEGEGDAVAGGGIAGASPRETGEPGGRPAPRRFEADGGIARLPAPPRGLPVPPGLPGGRTRESAPSVLPGPEAQGGTPDAERSAGWRLGQARARIATVEPRIARMRELIAGFEERGETEAAQRQRVIMQRFETRLAELRTEETELATQAQSDGTLGEEQQGFDATHVADRPPIPVAAPPSPAASP